MMAASVKNGSGGRQRQRQTTTAADDNCMWVADYDGEGQEQTIRDGGDIGVVMMAAAAEDGCGGRRQR
jgi:hypothetical protein